MVSIEPCQTRFTAFVPVSCMLDARNYLAHETLRNGVEVQIRALRPDDGERIAEAFGKLEGDSIRSRFFGVKTGLTEREHRLIRELDFDRQVALVVTLMEHGREVIIGSGSYSRMAPDAAEIAFLMEEDYHGLGMARCVLWHLGLIARDRGILRFEADVLPHNRAMRRVFAASGWPMTAQRVDDVIHITLDLTPS
ncbi:MAG TPA: GNAT family protein [Candidatus Saccharimonadia bacterium]|nr:GNAT family protein [Candidatus Saccharimonadia bacterium]